MAALTNVDALGSQQNPAHCAERGCLFFATPGSNLCAYHVSHFMDDEYAEYSLEVLQSSRKWNRHIRHTRELNLDFEDALRIMQRGSYVRTVFEAMGRCNRCGAEREAGNKFCPSCLVNNQFRNLLDVKRRRNWHLTGKCTRCGGDRTGATRTCSRCADILNTWRKRRRESGICRCGRTQDRWPRKLCSVCAPKWSTRAARRKSRLLKLRHCAICGRAHDGSKKHCSVCLEKANAAALRRYRNFRSAGLCISCKRPTQNGACRCAECASKELRRLRSGRAYELLRLRRYHTRRESTRCKLCGANPPTPKHSLCESCIANTPKRYKENALKRRLAWIAAGLCTQCGRTRDRKGKLCARCAKRGARKARLRLERLRQLSASASSERRKQVPAA